MTTLTDVFNRHLIGFDDLFIALERGVNNKITYPPCDIVKVSDALTRVDIAVAGFTREELSVVLEDNTLKVSGNKVVDQKVNYVQKGISYRNWSRKWTLHKQVEVQDVKLENGILSIEVVHHLPEAKKPLQLEIK